MRKNTSGFTIVELLVVIAVIGILSAISLVSFNRYQASARDAQRSARATVISEALEKYYDKNGEYPSCAAVSGSAASVLTTLVGIQTEVLVTPQNQSGDNSIKCQDLQASDPDIFAFIGDGSATCSSGASCLQYTLKYKEESTGTIKSVTSRRQTDIATSGTAGDLVATTQGFQTVKLDWSEVSNAATYAVQRAANCTFSSPTNVLPSPTTDTVNVGGLTPGTSYCFRIAPIILGTTGAWSNTPVAVTRQLSTPVISTANNDIGAISVTWSDISYEQSYVLEYTTVNGTWSNTPITLAANATSRVVTGLTPGATYYFRLQARATTNPADQDTSNYSTVVSRVAPELGTPTLTATSGSASEITASWNAITYADSYRIAYNASGAVDGNGNLTGATVVAGATSPYVISGLTGGTTRYFQVRAEATNDVGDYSAVDSATTIIPTPTCSTTTLNSNTQATIVWGSVAGAANYTIEYSSSSAFSGAASITGATGTSRAIGGLNNGTTYYFRVKGVNGANQGGWGTCPSRATGVDGPTSVTWSGRGEAVRCYGCVAWMPGQDPGYGSTWYTVGMYISGTCQPGATVVTRLYSYYAYSNGTGANNASLMDWTWGAQDRYMVSGNDSWYGWFQGWVACQVGSTRAGDTYLGNAGPY